MFFRKVRLFSHLLRVHDIGSLETFRLANGRIKNMMSSGFWMKMNDRQKKLVIRGSR
jgi:hypothetical protein